MQTLKKRAEFLAIAKNGKRHTASTLVLQALDNELGKIRVGYTVTKVTEKSAVGRNRIKRRLRSAAKDVIVKYARPSCDYVLIGRAGAKDRPYKLLCNDIHLALEKLGFTR